ncbi:hypothetical protein FRC11_008932 [Ceratobasidium sp. 423]|nr:hypothetical protein FRC11_008932 [Ceratobasidium sp. 423]
MLSIIDDSAAIDAILRELFVCVKAFKCPSELDFSFNPKNPMILASTEPNKPFMNQLRKLHGLQSRLSEIPTSDNEQLEKKHRATEAAIAKALERMTEQQLKLHEKFMASAKEAVVPADEADDTGFELIPPMPELAADSAIDSKLKTLVDLVKDFKFPAELDFKFSASAENPMMLVNNEKNKPFIDQLRKLNNLRKGVADIRPVDEEQRKKVRATEAAIVVALKAMEEQQVKLYEKFVQDAKAKEEEALENMKGTSASTKDAGVPDAVHRDTGVDVKQLSREERDRQIRLCGDVTNAMINPDASLNDILRELVTRVKGFKFPTELDFSDGIKNTLPPTEKNRVFITQLRKLDELRTRLVDIPVHGNERLEAKHKAAGIAIGLALQRMKEYQRNLYEKQTAFHSGRLPEPPEPPEWVDLLWEAQFEIATECLQSLQSRSPLPE